MFKIKDTSYKQIKVNISGRGQKKGFTLIEIIFIIIIMGILARISVALFLNLKNEAKEAVESFTVASIRQGISDYRMESEIKRRTFIYPVSLDNASDGAASTSNPFFDNVLQPVISDWSKAGNNYTSFLNRVYSYNNITGTFE
ncbi:MAG: prepilin-type N-terminal cleavage/methylation domain-containing protein [Candidatus Omnitrophota bacterium]